MPTPLDQATAEILARLDIGREAEQLGVRFASPGPNASGWRECHAINREDKKPSAAINVASPNGALGMYTDLATSEKLSFWDLAARLQPGRFRDWMAARDHFAEQVGITLAKGRAGKGKGQPKALAEQIRFLCNEGASAQLAVRQWAEAKPGISEAAVKAAFGRYASWPANAPDEKKLDVIAFPAFQPGAWDKPTAAILYRPNGKSFPGCPNGPGERKSHTLRGSIDSLIVVGGPEALAAAEIVWICEGLPDALTLASHIPAGHVAVTNTHGANKFAVELAAAFAGKCVRIVGDADQAGVDGAKIRASVSVPVAGEVKIVTLPYEVTESHGKDLRDFFVGKHTFEELAQLAAAAPVLTAADVPPPPRQSTGRDRKKKTSDRPEARISNVEVIRHDKDERGQEGKSSVEVLELTMHQILAKIRQETGDWPCRVDQMLFVHEANEVSRLSNAAALFGFLQSRTGIVDWREGDCNVTKAEVFAELQRAATRYVAIEELPHHPPIAQHYYACREVGEGDGSALAGLLDRFNPASDIDRDLIQAALMTLFWGGAGGTRPAFVITADLGRGKGKSKTAEMLGRVAGGAIDFSHNEEIETIKKRLLSAGTGGRRMALLDNVKSLRFSWGELEALITAPLVSGWRLYVGEGTCPNTFTWFLTLNGAAFSKDMAQRSVIIKIGEPTRSGTWEDDTKAFIDCNRGAIIADIISLLKSPPASGAQLASYSRWATWENAVLMRLPDPAEAQRVILDRQEIVDVEAEEVATVVEYFDQQIKGLGYCDRDQVLIPSKVAADWYNAATGEKRSVTWVGRLLKQFCNEGQTKRLRPNACKTYGRGLVWQGYEVDAASPICLDLVERLDKRQEQQFR